MSEVAQVLSAIHQGDALATQRLLPLVYNELRALAAQMMAKEKPGQSLQATALVHEAYMRLVGVDEAQHWDSRGHFFAAAAEAMRRILVDQARRRHAAKRGGQAVREELHETDIAGPELNEDVLAVSDVLDILAGVDPVAANLVKLRFFAGLTMGEIAEVLGMSVRSAQEIWAYARSWLKNKMRPE
jgi:RNA polymerase sigma factor (TIGR02999 family)